MKFIRTVGLCLAAVFVLGAMAASSASATAGLLLARVKGGASGSIAGVSFLSLGEGALLTTHGGKDIHCSHVHNFGLFLSATLGNVLIRFLNCFANTQVGELECKTSGESGNNIHLPFATTLFHLGLAHLTLAVGRLPAAVILLTKDVEISCGGGLAEILVLGNVIGALQLDPSEKPIPLGQPFANAILNFEQTANGLQHLRLLLFEDTLNTYDLDSITTSLGEKGPVELSAEDVLALLDLFLLSGGKHVELELFED